MLKQLHLYLPPKTWKTKRRLPRLFILLNSSCEPQLLHLHLQVWARRQNLGRGGRNSLFLENRQKVFLRGLLADSKARLHKCQRPWCEKFIRAIRTGRVIGLSLTGSWQRTWKHVLKNFMGLDSSAIWMIWVLHPSCRTAPCSRLTNMSGTWGCEPEAQGLKLGCSLVSHCGLCVMNRPHSPPQVQKGRGLSKIGSFYWHAFGCLRIGQARCKYEKSGIWRNISHQQRSAFYLSKWCCCCTPESNLSQYLIRCYLPVIEESGRGAFSQLYRKCICNWQPGGRICGPLAMNKPSK